MNKSIDKSQKIVSKAVGVFDNAIANVEKANEILKKGIEADSMRIMANQAKIDDLNAENYELERAKGEKGQEIRNNEQIIASLRQFSKNQ